MAMGKRRRRAKQASMWVATQDLPQSAAQPVYTRLNQILDQYDFDEYVEGLCERFYASHCAIGLAVSSPRRVPRRRRGHFWASSRTGGRRWLWQLRGGISDTRWRRDSSWSMERLRSRAAGDALHLRIDVVVHAINALTDLGDRSHRHQRDEPRQQGVLNQVLLFLIADETLQECFHRAHS